VREAERRQVVASIFNYFVTLRFCFFIFSRLEQCKVEKRKIAFSNGIRLPQSLTLDCD